MGDTLPVVLPGGAALMKWAARIMEVILHVGAHRTGTASLRAYLRRHAVALRAKNVGFWGPRRLKRAFGTGEILQDRCADTGWQLEKARAQLQVHLDQAERRGVKTLFISDPDLCGTVCGNLHQTSLYPRVVDRFERYFETFEGRLSAVVLSPRALDLYWCSAVSHGVAQGAPVPDRAALAQIAHGQRSWRNVISEIAASIGRADLRLLPIERFRGRPDAFLAASAGLDAPKQISGPQLNTAPTLPALRRILNDSGVRSDALPFGMGKWNPFTNEEHAALREMHADDMLWMQAGADGLATMTQECREDSAELNPPRATKTKGHCDELEDRKMARPG